MTAQRGRAGVRRALVLVAVVLLAASLGARVPHATAVAPLDIVSVQHDPRGQIRASLHTPTPDAVVSGITAWVDGAPQHAELVARPQARAAVVIAIDTSASMAGEPLLSARRAAMALIDRLAPGDEVALVGFADEPQLLVPFTTDRARTAAALDALVAGGNTALYDAVSLSAELLAESGDRPRVLVLLTDGEDYGAVRVSGRAASLEQLAATGAEVQAFALGTEADTTFLVEAAARSTGAFTAIPSSAALDERFSNLGSRLGAALELAVQVPPLTPGEHRLEIRARVDGEPAASSSRVPVTNDGLLAARTRPGTAGESGMLVIDVTTMTPPGTLSVRAEAGGTPLAVLDDPLRVLIDPWRLAPGPVDVHVTARIAGTLVSTTTVALDVPALSTELHVGVRPSTDGSHLVLRGRTQGPAPATLVARVDGRELARGPLPELRVERVHGERITATIEDAAGHVLASEAHPLPAAAAAQGGASAAGPWSLAAAALALIVGVPLSARARATRRGAVRRRAWEPSARTMLVGRAGGPRGDGDERMGTLVVRTPEGGERRYPMTRRTLSLGRGADCDVVIADPAIGTVHARVRALGGGEFQVHGIAPRRQLPFAKRHDEWMVVRQGEQIAIGTHELTLLAPEVDAHG